MGCSDASLPPAGQHTYLPDGSRDWRRIYVKEGVAGLMKTQKHPKMKIEAPTPSGVSEEIEALKARIRDLELENDILRQTICNIKKRPGRQPNPFEKLGEGSDR